MKTKILKLLLVFAIVIISSCNGQTNKEKQQSASNQVAKKSLTVNDTSFAPKYNVSVNKQYDDSGHLIKYDSSYSYSYSSPGGPMQIKDDTIYKRFKAYFRKNFSNSFNGPFGDMFYQDSLFKYDFFNDDYFLKRFEMNNHELSRMYSDMDSIKAEFLKKNYPNGRQKKNK